MRATGYLRGVSLSSALLVTAILHRKKRKDESIVTWIVVLVAGSLLVLGLRELESSMYAIDQSSSQICQEVLMGTFVAIILNFFEFSQSTTPLAVARRNLEGGPDDMLDYQTALQPIKHTYVLLGASCATQMAFAIFTMSITGELQTYLPSVNLLLAILQDVSLLLGALLMVLHLRTDAVTALLSLSTCATFGMIAGRGAMRLDSAFALAIFLAIASAFDLKGLPSRKYMAFSCSVLLSIYTITGIHGSTQAHPLKSLIARSRVHLDAFTERESQASTLESACTDYIERYGRLPPPGFDKWYKYAKEHKAMVISNFDQIERDLAPFWHVAPAEVRQRTYEAVQNRNNYLAPLNIRDGKVTSPPMEQPTHYWQLESLMKMMQDFVPFLPDMDLAINLNDEPRVIASPERSATKPKKKLHTGGSFTLNATSWAEEIPFTDQTHRSFWKQERQLKNVYDYSTQFCPSDSLSRLHYLPKQAANPYYAVDGSLALDICQHPELKDTRGFFVSPTSFDVTNELMPVFSQSKPSTFSDIIIPSPWNFQDKVGENIVDQILWEDKYDRAHWRGSASEGWAIRGSWKRMLRQSLVDFMGGAKQHTTPFTPTKSMLYEGTDIRGYKARAVLVQELQEALSPDVFFVGIGRAEDDQEAEEQDHFQIQEPNDFSTHWQYRYLLDTDGAGFSGRFLSFLESQSLPLKLDSIFTEWWVDRIIPHQHFVPVTLNSIYSTWIYFVGLKDKSGKVIVDSHQDEAQQIAQQGREWAKQALRKDDMVLYLWRLLLEYGRVVDDHRDTIGYKHEA